MLGEIKIPTRAELFVGDLAATGNWVVACVRSSVSWPLKVEVIEFRGHRIFVVPRCDSSTSIGGTPIMLYPSVAVNLPQGTAFKDGVQLVSHFLSSLTWVEGEGITVEHWTGGSRANPMGENRMGGVVTAQFELEYLPDPTSKETRWALAFYREGLSLERSNVAYSTLSYFKVLNIVSRGKAQIGWINEHHAMFGLNSYQKFEVSKRIAELKLSGVQDIGEYLYGSCRCAVAHAGTDPTVDPENPDDMERLRLDLPVIRTLASYVIEKELGLKSSQTVWHEHLYELEGFKRALGPEVTGRLMAKDNSVNREDLVPCCRC